MEKKFHVSRIFFFYIEIKFEFLDEELGFHSFLSLLRSMPDVVFIECKDKNSSYRVHPVYDQSTAHIQKMVLEQRDKYQYQNTVRSNLLLF